jgi:uncharacterized membrane protein YdjX (TVP38/TMEM64 family)
MNRRWHKYVIFALWLLLLLALWLYTRERGKTPVGLLRMGLEGLRGEPLAPLYLLGIYLVRPLFLLPISLLTVTMGVLFGPVLGLLYATIASLLSTTVAYFLGRWFGSDVPPNASTTFRRRLEAFPFETVLLCRFLAIPGDLVNYLSGYLKISYRAFLLATAIGGLPGLLIGVLAGASLDTTRTAFKLDGRYLLASAALLVLSLLLSWWVRTRVSGKTSELP